MVEGFITGLHKSPYHGFSVEFAEHRIYNKGESTKHIDWKLFARTDKLFVKRYEEETNLRTQILIDISSSMYFPYQEANVQTKLFFSVLCSAALIYMLRKQRDAAGLTLFSDNIDFHTEAKLSSVYTKLMYGELDKLVNTPQTQLRKTTSTAKIIHQISDNIHKRSLVILFTDMFSSENAEDMFSALQHLRHNKHEVILFHVIDKQKEVLFDYKNRPYKFVDMETGESVKLNPNQIKDEYKKQMAGFNEELKIKCGQYNIDLVDVDIHANFKDILIPYLIKRQKLY